MKKLLFLTLFGLMGMELFAQQIPNLTQYYFNHYSVNPAATGITDDLPLAFSYRKLWTGIDQSPSVQYLSGNMQFVDAMGAGVKIFNYSAGPYRKSGMELTYSYHLEFQNDLKLAFGLSALVYQFNLNRSDLTFLDMNDNVLLAGEDNVIVPDASFGTYLYSDAFYVGISAPQILGRNIDMKSDQVLQQTQVRHYYLMGGYNFIANRDLILKPSLLMKFVEVGLFQVDVNAILEYRETFIGGISYRSSDAIIFQLGFQHEEIFFGYSYDLPLASATTASLGSHEVMVKYTLPNFLK